MNVKFLKSSNSDKLSFVLSDAYPEIANALRRSLISEVPVMAISKVDFIGNNSALYNEMMALRLGLIPLKSNNTYVMPSECSCKGVGCAKCSVKLTLEVKGPGMVYARDLISSDSSIVPVNPDTPIIKLFENQAVKLEATAVMGLGREHARFNACMASYQYYPKISGSCDCKNAVSVCPKSVLEYKDKKVSVVNLEACDLCLACVDACSCGKLKVEGRSDKFIFNVESWGQYEPKELVKTGIKSILTRLSELSDKTKE